MQHTNTSHDHPNRHKILCKMYLIEPGSRTQASCTETQRNWTHPKTLPPLKPYSVVGTQYGNTTQRTNLTAVDHSRWTKISASTTTTCGLHLMLLLPDPNSRNSNILSPDEGWKSPTTVKNFFWALFDWPSWSSFSETIDRPYNLTRNATGHGNKNRVLLAQYHDADCSQCLTMNTNPLTLPPQN